MKKKAGHPEYHEVTVTCGCGNSWTTGSTAEKIQLSTCSACHPYYTGKQRILDAAGMVERFQRKWTSDDAQKKAKQHAEIVSRKESPIERARRRAEQVLKGNVRIEDIDKPAAAATPPAEPKAEEPKPGTA